MSRDVEFAAAGDTVQQAATLMGEIDVGALPVGSAVRTLGVVTARDLLLRVCAAGRDPTTTTVTDVMTAEIHHCRADDGVETALDLMASRHVRRLLVRDGHDAVVGWVTLSDISRRLLIDSGTVRTALDELSGR
ncbi:CBS domain-containing protein [Sphingomonas rubra]|uniref:CBS domain-containing protein n=2 Tax=Sphingomonas rubra TaxID=634430 RepID=A0A1I5RG66_9SPHN|nr:CBS domain-containing protein [Sphingomonas rubra]